MNMEVDLYFPLGHPTYGHGCFPRSLENEIKVGGPQPGRGLHCHLICTQRTMGFMHKQTTGACLCAHNVVEKLAFTFSYISINNVRQKMLLFSEEGRVFHKVSPSIVISD